MAGGRPDEFTDLVVMKLEQAFALDCSVSEACFNAGISRTMYYAHVKEGDELHNRFQALREKPVLKARTTVVAALNNPADAQWYLERKRKNEFSSRSEHTGPDGEKLFPVPIDDVRAHPSIQENKVTE